MTMIGGSITPAHLSVGRTERRTGETVLTVIGEIDMTTGNRFRTVLGRALDTADLRRLTVDVGALGFIDSHGVSALLWAMQVARERNVGFVVTNAGGQIRTIFEMLGVYELLADTED